jgi:hypothetical protein
LEWIPVESFQEFPGIGVQLILPLHPIPKPGLHSRIWIHIQQANSNPFPNLIPTLIPVPNPDFIPGFGFTSRKQTPIHFPI